MLAQNAGFSRHRHTVVGMITILSAPVSRSFHVRRRTGIDVNEQTARSLTA